MKFGLNYHKLQMPAWAEHYIDYNGLRMQLRVTAQRGSGFEGKPPLRRTSKRGN